MIWKGKTGDVWRTKFLNDPVVPRWLYVVGGALLTALSLGWIAVIMWAGQLHGRPKADSIYSVRGDDPEMNAAIAKARETLPDFWRSFEHPGPNERGFSLKVRIEDKDDVEHVWVDKLERKDGKIFGTVNNDVEKVRCVKLGDRIQVPEQDVSDWAFLRNRKMVGNYTFRLQIKGMPPDEAAKAKLLLENP